MRSDLLYPAKQIIKTVLMDIRTYPMIAEKREVTKAVKQAREAMKDASRFMAKPVDVLSGKKTKSSLSTLENKVLVALNKVCPLPIRPLGVALLWPERSVVISDT